MSDFWWQAERVKNGEGSAELSSRVSAYIKGLETAQSMIRALNRENARLYSCRDLDGIGVAPIGSVTLAQGGPITITENVIGSVVDTATALIAANRPKPVFIPDGGDWELRQRAKNQNKFLSGLYDRIKTYPKAVRAFKSAGVYGTGPIKVFGKDGLPYLDRVHPDDLIVDEQEARDCEPRQMHQRKWIDADVLKGMAKKWNVDDYEKVVDDAVTTTNGRGRMANRMANMVEVFESWRLPSDKGADDGRHCITIANATLMDEEWDKSYFPFAIIKWNEPEVGWYGKGMVEDLTGLQMRLNQLNKFIRACQDRIARPDIYGDFDQRMPDNFFQNGIGRYFRTKGGKPPTFYTPQALNRETYDERRYIVERMFALAGVSEMSAQAKKQPGITSGIAINAVSDIQTGRFALQSEAFEDFHLQLGELCIWTMKDLAAGKSVKVAFKAKSFVETIDWAEVAPEGDEFKLDIEASSILSRTPAGRLQQAMDMLQAGAIDKEQWARIVDIPDIQREMDLNGAALDYANRAAERCLAGEYVGPEPFENLQMSLATAQKIWLDAKLDGAPDVALEILLRRMDMLKTMIQEATAPPAAPPMPGPGIVDPAMAGVPGAMPAVPGAALPPPGTPLPNMPM